MSVPVISTNGLSLNFGGLKVINGVNLAITKGDRHALIGPNGAGKTTLINLLTGYLQPSAGSISLMGSDITSNKQSQRCQKGLVRTFQINQLFANMTVIESICMAVSEQKSYGNRWFKPISSNSDVVQTAVEIMQQLGLLAEAFVLTKDLSYGKQRLIEIALALALKPKVLLLDEPAAGVSAAERTQLYETVFSLADDVTILLVEHDMNLVFNFAHRISVLVAGSILVEDTPVNIAKHPKVKEVYLGETYV